MKHILQQPFVAATGLAALLHSTWALGTLFAGPQPEAGLTVAFLGWLLPALLIAFALDVGQISTSAEIRRHGMTWARGLTFATFALATYYLQWLYIAHHMPALDLAPGVRPAWAGLALLVRDAALWIIPALLPASTLLYTFSGRQEAQHEAPAQQDAPAPSVTISAPPAELELDAPLPWDELPAMAQPAEAEAERYEIQETFVTHEQIIATAHAPKWAGPGSTPAPQSASGPTESVSARGGADETL